MEAGGAQSAPGVIGYAFTRPGATSPFSGERWPGPAGGAPGAWFGRPHACRAEHLPIWVADELWRIELDGHVEEVETRIFADRGRLLERVTAWDEDAARAFAVECCARTREWVEIGRRDGRGLPAALDAFAADAGAMTNARSANVAGYVAARAAAHVEGPAAAGAERRRQAEWIMRRLTPAG